MARQALDPQALRDLARLAYGEGKYADAIEVASQGLNAFPDDWYFLLVLSRCMAKVERFGLATNLARRAVQVAPANHVCWSALGYAMMMNEERMPEAIQCFEKALAIKPDDFSSMANLICINVNMGEPAKAIEWAEKASWNYSKDDLEQEYKDVVYNRGIAELMLRHWPDGWKHYCHSHRHRIKKEWAYGDEGRWDGKPVDTLVVYGEQGLGDEIMFASAIPDVAKMCRQVVVDCDPRLVGMFRRSLPANVDVYGTRNDTHPLWDREYKISARAGVADVCRFTRNRFEDFPGTPFMKADPQRRLQWRALLDSLGPKPKIGLAWNGGKKGKSFWERRSLTLQELTPILSQDATWVDLEYIDAAKAIEQYRQETGTVIHHWPHALLTQDYDDTAALVAELDLVICVTTTIMNLSGALGVPCWCFTPRRPTWREGLEGDHLPWYGQAVTMFRQENHMEWQPVIDRVADRLSVWLKDRSRTAWASAS